MKSCAIIIWQSKLLIQKHLKQFFSVEYLFGRPNLTKSGYTNISKCYTSLFINALVVLNRKKLSLLESRLVHFFRGDGQAAKIKLVGKAVDHQNMVINM